MSNQRITSINVKQEDGTYKNYPLGTNMDNVINQNNKTLTQVLQDNNNNFNLSIDGNELTLATPNGYTSTVTLPASGGQKKNNDVTFFDYDGTVLYSYTADEFLTLSEMPQNPTHEGLTAQGWNWSFEDAQTYVNNYGMLNIGQMYITDDGKTRLYITIDELDNQREINIRFKQSVANGVTVDWGDGSVPETYSSTSLEDHNHTYSVSGNYIISLAVSSGKITFGGGNSSNTATYGDIRTWMRKMINKIEFGDNVIIEVYAFKNCENMKTITLPSSINFLSTQNGYAFSYCYNLQSVVFPSSTNTKVRSYEFANCNNIKRVSLPYGLHTLEASTFSSCYLLNEITIPSTITIIGQNAFSSCSSLKDIIIPSSVTKINSNGFAACYNIRKLIIPSSVTTIGTYAFSSCYGAGEYHFKSTTPPSLESINAFSNIPTETIFYVPYSEDHSILEAYKSATNWSTYASRMQEEPQS